MITNLETADVQIISEDEFWEKYQPIPNHIDQTHGFTVDEVRYLFETYGEELEFVLAQNSNHIWTLMEGEINPLFIGSGYHLVNRIGYFITKVPFEDNVFIEIPLETVDDELS